MKINKRLEVELVDMGGLRAMFEALRLPYGLDCRSETSFDYNKCPQDLLGDLYQDVYKIFSDVAIIKKDYSLLQTLIKRGDEHAKVTRGLIYYLKITAPRWWWVECSTYVVGTISLAGTSTMHIDCKGLSGEELMEFKDKMPQGNLETRIIGFSLQTLQRIHKQRHDHRLPLWQDFCKFLETLPMSELITGKND